MNMKNKMRYLVFAGIAGLSACNLEVEKPKGKEKKKPVTVSETFAPYTGQYVASASALSQGLGTECDLNLDVEQSKKSLRIKELEYTCDDGSSWGFSQEMNFELRKPSDRLQLAYDIYHDGTYVGFLNYSNTYAYIGLTQVGGSITLALSQSKKGRTVEDFRIVSNGWLLFDANPSVLTEN